MVPLPRRTLDAGNPTSDVQQWYENELGWATVPGPGSSGLPVHLVVGLRFDVLDVPAEAGFAALKHRGQALAPGFPVALSGDRMRMRLLVAAGSADELPGLLDWLEWGRLTPDLRAIGAGGTVEAPLPPGPIAGTGSPHGHGPGRETPQGAAVWLRPPETGHGTEIPLPTMSALGGVGGAPDLVRLVDTLATHCHRVRLRRACAQPLAFS